MNGWIKLHRTINKHWIFNDPDKFRAWIAILLNVNHEKNKVNLGNLILTCERGESLKSLDSWAKLFGNNWNKSKVRRFFELLKNDSMIVLKNEHKTTRLTVCKYDSYQDKGNANETNVKRKRNTSETQLTPNKNEKNEKEIYRSFAHLKISINENKKILDLGYNQNQLDSIYDSIENYKKNTTYISLNLTARKWLKKEYPNIKIIKLIDDGIERFDTIYDGDPKHYMHSLDEIKTHEIKFATRKRNKS